MNKVSAIQMTSTPIVDENLVIVKSLIKTAVENGTNLVVLPEMFPIVGLKEHQKIIQFIAPKYNL